MKRLLTAAVAGLIVLTAAACASRHADFEGMAVDESAPDFTLTDQDGRPFRLSSQRGSEVVLFFGYTHCPDVCPTTMANLAQALRGLPAQDRSRIHVAFVTVDENRDDPATLGRYVRLFNPKFYGLTGTTDQLEPVYRAYHVYHKKLAGTKAGGYLVAHGSVVYMIDPQGMLRVEHGWGDTYHSIAHDMKELLS